ncbi:MAG: hydantoinase B/oxoprolinase family protein [Candidatus Rokubacteria bacterium]|nr:hydantoinase B/oxoprolinase family protein [Candidatus Rokubacteria bacterium]
MSFDPITFQVLWSRVVSVADEVAATLVKTAFSHVVRDNHDYSCGLYDAEGRMLAQSTQCTPGQIGAMPRVMKDFLARYPAETLTPGDVLITNDPWFGSGHTPDVFVAAPIFRRDRLVGFAVNSAHHIDFGGRLSAPDARDVYEEGLIIPITKLATAGTPNRDLLELIARNVRMPDKVIGDLRAQMAADWVGARRLVELMDERGLESLGDLSVQIMDHTEASMRAAIAEAPDGTYENAVTLERPDPDGRPIRIVARVEIAGDRVHVDFTGTTEQVDLPINAVTNITYAYTVFPIKCALHPHIPANEGCFRPVTMTVPEGTCLNPRYPAAVRFRTSLVYYVVEVIFGALARAIPDRVMAPSGTYPLWLGNFAGRFDDGRPFVLHFNAQGGTGARRDRDGVSTLVFPPNVANTPIELLEVEAPLLCERKALVPDSGGPGRQRGGLGQEVVIRNVAAQPVLASVIGGRFHDGAPGLAGGGPGGTGILAVNEGAPLGRNAQVLLKTGDAVLMRFPGGGGFGDPRTRDPGLVAADVRRGLVSVARAAEDYGVALGASLEVDGAATARLRAGRR